MSISLLLAQMLNGLQYGVMLFLLAAGLTLVFGIMSFVNLAHGSLYMLGAYAAAVVSGHTGSFGLGVLAAVATGLVVGIATCLSCQRCCWWRWSWCQHYRPPSTTASSWHSVLAC